MLILTLLVGTSRLATAEDAGEMETRHGAAVQSFETETRAELTRIARDESLTGEEKIIRIEQWFGTHADRIAEINLMADTLDESIPLLRPTPPNRPVDPTPEDTAAKSLHDLSRSLAKGDITSAEFDRLREPLLDQLSTVTPSRKAAPARLPAPYFPEDLAVTSSPEALATALHAQNRHLASLPENEAAEIRADLNSPVNHLLAILEKRQQAGITTAPPAESPNQSTKDHQ